MAAVVRSLDERFYYYYTRCRSPRGVSTPFVSGLEVMSPRLFRWSVPVPSSFLGTKFELANRSSISKSDGIRLEADGFLAVMIQHPGNWKPRERPRHRLPSRGKPMFRFVDIGWPCVSSSIVSNKGQLSLCSGVLIWI